MAKKLSDLEKKTALKALGDFRGEATKLMKDKMKGLKKVTVASNSEEGLEHGLEKASEVLKKGNPLYSSEQANDNFEDREDDDIMEDAAEEMCADEDLDAKIQELMARKEALKNKSGSY